MDQEVLFARPDGKHYHTDRNCPVLQQGNFEKLGYREVTLAEIMRGRLRTCSCVGQIKREAK